jgi:UDP-N-acetylmuramoylalanine--D-glutamate ligase
MADLTAARSLPGRHNWQNAAAAYSAARALGVSAQEAIDGLMSFPGLAHRMETIGTLDGVRFVNDSKATNIDAARQAMSAYPRFHWIAGGRPKTGIACLGDLFGSVARAYLIGEATEDFARTLEGKVPFERSDTVEAAVRSAFDNAVRSGESEPIVLFSPACASFDQFSDFEARGDAFRAAVHALALQSQAGDRL